MSNGSGNILINALWGTVKSVTGVFGLQPIWIAYAIGGLLLIGAVQQIYGSIRNRSSFTLEKQEDSYFYRDSEGDE